MKKLIPIAVLSLVFIIISSGCIQEKSKFNYTIGGCEPKTYFRGMNKRLFYTYRNDEFHIYFVLDYVCCANLTIKQNLDGKDLYVYIKNDGEMCKCMCSYPVHIVEKLPEGKYNVHIMGIKYKDIYNYSSLYNFTIDPSSYNECEKDADCVHEPSCCHVKSQECIPFFMKKDIKCVGVACTMECRSCKTCFCENGRCVSESVEGCC